MSRNTTWRHRGEQDKALGLLLQTSRSHAKCTWKTNKRIALVTLWVCFCSSFAPQSTYSLKAAAQVCARGMNCPSPLFGWVDLDAPVGVVSGAQSAANAVRWL